MAKLDPATTVTGCTGTPYPCPDVASVDAHIEKLHRSILRNPPKFQRLADEWRYDIDLLLERRHYLTTVQVPA